MTRLTTIGIALALGGGLAGCAAPVAKPAVGRPAIAYTSVGLERVLGQDAAGLTKLFGQPDADVREGSARKLQFQSGICVLDAYLYPKGSDAPRVTYLDAREPDGSAIDRASCVAALTRREGGR
ncbi:hypothetical protein IFT67_07425 [Sphingomonas sp. CFBP 13728]|uniref:hypothetical protein n=1 Tax=unclassified Sphingomonas TaxID=196159 RepID=UPI00177BDAE9|nr:MULTISPECIES: hypothetical protein [unclassified Sphingomonas]MBD8618751.1 hypothetical protein [Sphingomonas sp. CFBP 13728]MBE2991537.1 hypothetical protein [Sphingomonas sp. CFBP 13603]